MQCTSHIHLARSRLPTKNMLEGSSLASVPLKQFGFKQVALKASDIAHLAAPQATHKKWTALLCEEFFLQGDREPLLCCFTLSSAETQFGKQTY